MNICDYKGHEFVKTGVRRIPCHGAFKTDMPLHPDGTIQMEDFKCKNCPETHSQETLYSWRKNTVEDIGDRQ